MIQYSQQGGGWQPVPIEGGDGRDVIAHSFRQFVRMMDEGADHPLSGESGLKDLEIVMAMYESARLRARIELPLQQPRFPLEIMIENGEM